MLILSLNWRSLEGVWVIWLPVRVILLWESCIHSHVVPIIGCDPWCVMSIIGWSYSDVSTILLKEILSNGRPIPWGKVISRSCALACLSSDFLRSMFSDVLELILISLAKLIERQVVEILIFAGPDSSPNPFKHGFGNSASRVVARRYHWIAAIDSFCLFPLPFFFSIFWGSDPEAKGKGWFTLGSTLFW